MPERVQKTKTAPKQDEAVEKVEASVDSDAEKLKAETDAFLDEIDEELAENDALAADFWADIDEALGDNLEQASEFVHSFIQKGGQ
jgi:ubiquitin-like protein Pup